ncbi:uncharacterized protein METZ01_LOCUS146680, partial [marine metagenome]
MHGRTVVPHDKVIDLPLVREDELRLIHMVVQLSQQRVSLATGHAVDVAGQMRVHIEGQTSRFGVCTHDGVDGGLRRVLLFHVMPMYGTQSSQVILTLPR